MAENILDNDFQSSGIHLDAENRGYLAEVARWSRFLAIVGFISIGLLVLIALFAGVLLGSVAAEMGGGLPMNPGFLTGIYLLIALVYLFPVLYLYRFSTHMRNALHSNNQQALTTSFKNLKSCFKFIGIVTIVFLALYALLFVFGLAGASMMGM